jgi:hypothetical protein
MEPIIPDILARRSFSVHIIEARWAVRTVFVFDIELLCGAREGKREYSLDVGGSISDCRAIVEDEISNIAFGRIYSYDGMVYQ